MSGRVEGFGNRLRKLREKMGLNQEEFGEMYGVSRVSVSLYEVEKRTPDIAFLQAAVRKTGCGYEYLMGEETIDSERIKRLYRELDSLELMTARTYMEQALVLVKKLEARE